VSIVDSVLSRLSSAGYTTARFGDEIRFEDASVLGFVREFATARHLIEEWQRAQDQFLRANAPALRRDRRKSWNAYSVLLTSQPASEEEAQRLITIEEDFRATRKVVRAAVSTDGDVESALAVLLPIRRRVRFVAEDALARVSDRLSALPRPALEALLRGATGEEFAQALLRGEEEP